MNDAKHALTSEHDSATEKISLSLPVETVKKLEEIVYQARQNIPRAKAKQLTKSKLTGLVLNALIHECENGNGRCVIDSIIFNWIES